ncbi:MAG: hypothetical protein H7Y07_13975, partial [Pyrinomonadaceae bacterium]|nr:hypothetical protein [Sphingobacteriaceae bacterium]
KDGLYNNDLYYKYDHHWTVQSSLRATAYITERLNKLYKLNLDPNKKYSNYDNYNKVLYEDFYKGSIGTNNVETTGYEDFYKLYPKFSTNLTINSYDITKKLVGTATGKFEDSLIDNNKIIKGGPCFSSYLRGFAKQTEVVNHMADNNYKSLVVSTSIGRPFSAFLSPYFQTTAFIDLQPGKFDRSVYTYIDELKPKVLIFLYTAHTFGKVSVWEFDRK